MSVKTKGEPEVVITQEQLDKLEKGTLDMKTLSPEQMAQVEKIVSGEITEPAAPSDDSEVKSEASAVEPVKEEKSGDSKEFIPAVRHDEFKKAKDEANTFKQKADSLAKRLEEARAEIEAQKALASVQPDRSAAANKDLLFSDQHQIDLAEKVARLEAQVTAGVRGSQEKLERLERDLQEQKTMAEVNAFASEFPELKLSRSFEDVNAEYSKFARDLGATPDDMSVVDKYFQDPTFRKEREAKGIKAPKDYDQLQTILKVFHRKSKMGYPNFEDAYLGMLRSEGKLNERFHGKYLQGVEDAVNRIQSNKNETAVLDAGGSSESGFAMSEPQIEAWLKANPRPVTAAQKATMAQIQTYFETRTTG